MKTSNIMTMNNAPQRSSLAMAILLLLWESPLHPYGMQRLIKERGKDRIIDVKLRARIYQMIERLEKSGLVAVQETQRQERMPDRTVYALTVAGREVAARWLREAISTPVQEFPLFPAAISFMTALPVEDIRQQLQAREQRLSEQLAQLKEEAARYAGQLPRVFMLEDEYVRAMREAELRWVRAVIRDLSDGELAWDERFLRKIAEQNSVGTEKNRKGTRFPKRLRRSQRAGRGGAKAR